MRAKQTARKCMGSGPGPKHRDRLLCTGLVTRHRPSRDDSESDSDGYGADPGPREVVSDLKALFADRGLTYTNAIRTVDIPAEVLHQFGKVKKQYKWEQLPQDLRRLFNGDAPCKLYHLDNYGAPTVAVFLSEPLRDDQPALLFAGDLHTLSGWQAKHPDITDKVHLWAFDLAGPAFKRRGYKGPFLVLASDRRGNESRFLYDPVWHIKSWPPKFNMYMDIVWTTAPSHPEQVLPYLIFRADGNLRAGTELLISWGDQCWEALSRHEVLAQAGASWRIHYERQLLREHAERLEGSGENTAGPAEQGGNGAGGRGAVAAGPSTRGARGAAQAQKAKQPRPRAVPFDRQAGMDGSYLMGDTAPAAAPAADGSTASTSAAAAGSSAPPPPLPPPAVAYRKLTDAEVKQLFPAYTTETTFSGLSAGLLRRMDAQRNPRKARRNDAAAGQAAAPQAAGPSAAAAGSEAGRSRKVPARACRAAGERRTQRQLQQEEEEQQPQQQQQESRREGRREEEEDEEKEEEGAAPGRVAEGCVPATPEEEELIASGDLPGCVVAEIRALHHSVRYATPPNHKALTVLAKVAIRKGAPIGVYGGATTTAHKMDLVNKPERETYCFDASRKALRAVQPNVRWPGKGLVVDALKTGNKARFINDIWGQEDGRRANVEARIVWSQAKCRPYIMLYATMAVKAGEELTLQYGTNYWLFCARHLQAVHLRFFADVSAEVEELKERVRAAEGERRLTQLLAEIAARVDVNAKQLYDA